MAPAVGLEPTTKWLTATYSTAELCWIVLLRRTSINLAWIAFFSNQLARFFKNTPKIAALKRTAQNRRTPLPKQPVLCPLNKSGGDSGVVICVDLDVIVGEIAGPDSESTIPVSQIQVKPDLLG